MHFDDYYNDYDSGAADYDNNDHDYHKCCNNNYCSDNDNTGQC